MPLKNETPDSLSSSSPIRNISYDWAPNDEERSRRWRHVTNLGEGLKTSSLMIFWNLVRSLFQTPNVHWFSSISSMFIDVPHWFIHVPSAGRPAPTISAMAQWRRACDAWCWPQLGTGTGPWGTKHGKGGRQSYFDEVLDGISWNIWGTIYIYVFIYLFIYLSIYLFIYLSIYCLSI